MTAELQNISKKVKFFLKRLKRLLLIALSIYVIVMMGRFVYKIFMLMTK